MIASKQNLETLLVFHKTEVVRKEQMCYNSTTETRAKIDVLIDELHGVVEDTEKALRKIEMSQNRIRKVNDLLEAVGKLSIDIQKNLLYYAMVTKTADDLQETYNMLSKFEDVYQEETESEIEKR